MAISATLSFIIKPPPSLFGGLDDVETSIVGRIIYPGWGFIQQQVRIKHIRSTTRICHLKAQRCLKARRRLSPIYPPPGDLFVFGRIPPSNTFIFGARSPRAPFAFGCTPPRTLFFSGCTPPGTFRFWGQTPPNTFHFRVHTPPNTFLFRGHTPPPPGARPRARPFSGALLT